MGTSNLVITTIINVETFELLAGDYREYRKIEEVPAMLPAMAKIIINAAHRDTSGLPRLAVAPFSIAGSGVNVAEAETLAQILAIGISNTGKYAVLPRTSTMQTAMKELEIQMSGVTVVEGAKALGRAINAGYELSAEARSLGSANMFTASILHIETGSQLSGAYRNYRDVADGLTLMAELAALLTGTQAAGSKKQAADRLWTVGASVGTSFAAPWVIVTARGARWPLSGIRFLKSAVMLVL